MKRKWEVVYGDGDGVNRTAHLWTGEGWGRGINVLPYLRWKELAPVSLASKGCGNAVHYLVPPLSYRPVGTLADDWAMIVRTLHSSLRDTLPPAVFVAMYTTVYGWCMQGLQQEVVALFDAEIAHQVATVVQSRNLRHFAKLTFRLTNVMLYANASDLRQRVWAAFRRACPPDFEFTPCDLHHMGLALSPHTCHPEEERIH